jgi:hypothetical protein
MTDATRLVTVWFAYQGDVIKRHSAARSPLGRASDTCHVFQYAAAKEVYKADYWLPDGSRARRQADSGLAQIRVARQYSLPLSHS